MNETKFTPGPWLFSSYKSGNSVIVIDGKEFDVATVNYPNRDANAHLIAAAPELYEACEILFKITTGMMKQIPHSGFEPGSPLGKCEAALAKARGEA